jgi:transposase
VSKPWVVDDELWALIEPVLPPWPERSPGPRPVSDRLCLQGVLFVLYTGITWQQLPPELGFGSGQTCWRRLGRWTEAGVFDQLHRILLTKLNAAGELDWSRACVDASHVLAKKGGAATGPSPVDRRKTGSTHHLICDGNGTPLKVVTNVTQTLALVDGIPRSPVESGTHASALTPCSATRATTATPIAANCAVAASCRSSPDAAHLSIPRFRGDLPMQPAPR